MFKKFEVKKTISVKDAENIILENLQYSNYSSINAIKKYGIGKSKVQLTEFYNINNEQTLRDTARFNRNYEWQYEIENVADWSETFYLSTPNMMEIFTTHEKGTYVYDIPKNSDVITKSTYLALFLDSYENFERSIQRGSLSDFNSAVNKGISAIELSLRDAALIYNDTSSDKIDVDERIPFNEKIDKWIPIITNGKKFDKSGRIWNSYMMYRKHRDDYDQHLKTPYAFNYEELCSLMNQYKFAIPGMLFELDILFKRRISSAVIRTKYYPQISVVEKQEE